MDQFEYTGKREIATYDVVATQPLFWGIYSGLMCISKQVFAVCVYSVKNQYRKIRKLCDGFNRVLRAVKKIAQIFVRTILDKMHIIIR